MRSLITLSLCTVMLGAAQVLHAQNLDYLSLRDSTLAIVRDMPMEDLEAELDAISTLISSYERNKRDADHHKQLIQTWIEELKKEIDITKTKVELAKKEERPEDRDSLESDRKALETKKSYYEKAADVREYERRHAEALVDWTQSVRRYFEKAVQLMEEREREGRETDLLTLEQELIERQEEAADRLRRVGSEMSRLADRRKSLYRERDKILESVQ